MRTFIIATILAGAAALGAGSTAQAAPVAMASPVMSAVAAHVDMLATAPALLGASPEALLEPVQYGPRGDWRRRQEARRRAEWRRRQAHRRGGYRRY